MKPKTIAVFLLVLATVVSGVVTATVIQERATKKVTRVKRPAFTVKDWDGVYFEDLFKDGLAGARPEKAVAGQASSAESSSGSETESAASTNFAWSKLISRTTIEDEVKAIQSKLNLDITTPIKFKSEYDKSHQSFSILSMIFGVVREYDSDVRWKKHAAPAQKSFERAAANSRVGTIQAYESCKRRKEDLAEMVRGGNFAVDEKPPESLDWSIVVDRTPIMKRLQTSKDMLKTLTANETEFSDGIEKVLHESELVAMMAKTLMQENMNDADDEGYLAFAQATLQSAADAAEACRTQNYNAASEAINLMDQSCNNCHDEWK